MPVYDKVARMALSVLRSVKRPAVTLRDIIDAFNTFCSKGGSWRL